MHLLFLILKMMKSLHTLLLTQIWNLFMPDFWMKECGSEVKGMW